MTAHRRYGPCVFTTDYAGGTRLCLAPWVAIALDVYILGEDYSVKHIGTLLKTVGPDPAERRWETWMAQLRDPFAPWAVPLRITLFYAGAALIAAWQLTPFRI